MFYNFKVVWPKRAKMENLKNIASYLQLEKLIGEKLIGKEIF